VGVSTRRSATASPLTGEVAMKCGFGDFIEGEGITKTYRRQTRVVNRIAPLEP
jgi:hypothetical protein